MSCSRYDQLLFFSPVSFRCLCAKEEGIEDNTSSRWWGCTCFGDAEEEEFRPYFTTAQQSAMTLAKKKKAQWRSVEVIEGINQHDNNTRSTVCATLAWRRRRPLTQRPYQLCHYVIVHHVKAKIYGLQQLWWSLHGLAIVLLLQNANKLSPQDTWNIRAWGQGKLSHLSSNTISSVGVNGHPVIILAYDAECSAYHLLYLVYEYVLRCVCLLGPNVGVSERADASHYY